MGKKYPEEYVKRTILWNERLDEMERQYSYGTPEFVFLMFSGKYYSTFWEVSWTTSSCNIATENVSL